MGLNFSSGGGLFSNSEIEGEGLNPDPTMTVINNNGGINERARDVSGNIIYSTAYLGSALPEVTATYPLSGTFTLLTFTTQDISFIKFLKLQVDAKSTTTGGGDTQVTIYDDATNTQLLAANLISGAAYATQTAVADLSGLTWKGTRVFSVRMFSNDNPFTVFAKNVKVFHEAFFATSNEYTTGI